MSAYTVLVTFDADDLDRAQDAVDMINNTLPFVVDNLNVGSIAETLSCYGPGTPGYHVMSSSDRCVYCDAFCRHCGTSVRRDYEGAWIDATDGDGCDNPKGYHEPIGK